MSATSLILLIIVAVVVALVITGLVASRRRVDVEATDYARHVAEADGALERARATDRGWDRAALEGAARDALGARRPGVDYDDLHLVLVEDRPGVDEDRVHFVATDDASEDVRVVLARSGGQWVVERVD
ncbi:MAG: hypothetical protein H0V03_00050 [Thermoleophilaceae bacterium]|nr:hypothetical protein [Thermoleophilaceae bacterium]